MANRPTVKAWSASTDAELLGKHDELVKMLQDPAYASIDPSTVASGSPMHAVSRGTLSNLELELDKRGVTYVPSQGRILPMPGAAAAAAAPMPTPAAASASTSSPTANPRRQIPLGQPVQAAAPTSAPTAAPTATTKPVGRPVISVTASPPPPTGAGAQQASAQVTQTGNATPKPVAKVTATVQNTPPPPAKVVTSGAPTPKPLLKKTGDDISKALLGGTKGTRNIKLAGAAALLGLGAYTVNKKSHQTNDDYDRKLEMQRRGMMM